MQRVAEPYGSGTPLVFDTSAWNELAGARRLPAADYLIAAAAAERGFAVLHYDRHFDLLCPVLGIDSVSIAPLGDLD